MESREEIESMRVVELREFLRRHGHPMNKVTRENGTPGPMRKAELLEAALEIYENHIQGKPSPSRLSSAANASPNPFQSGLPSTPDRPRPGSGPTPPTDERLPSVSPAKKDPPPKSRRRSAAWVDPVLLAQMRATTPTKPRETSSRARPIAPRPSFDASQQLPSRVVPKSSPMRPAQRLASHPSPDPPVSRFPRRAPGRTPTRKPASMSRMPLPPRRLAVRKPDTEPPFGTARDQSSRIDAKQVVDVDHVVDVPPPSIQATSSPERRRLVLDIDEDYVSEEDPDYYADGEEADAADLDYADFDDADFDDDVADTVQAGPAPKYIDFKYGNSAGMRGDSIDVDADVEIQEDIPIDSDHYRSAGDSDPGSTVDTENEDQDRNFVDWSTADIKAWLRNHNVKDIPGANRDVLIGVARARALHMEATASIERQESTRQDVIEEEDEIVPNRVTEANVRRRRTISAPSPDDDSDVIEIQPTTSPATTSRRLAKTSKREFVYDRKPVRVEPKRRRPVFVLLPLIALFVFLCSSGFLALSVLRKHLTMTFCDTQATSTILDNGTECRPCPRNGHCAKGILQCDPGFVELRGRCLEDKEFLLFSERLAYSAFELMSELAGRAECGEDVPRAISSDELANAMHSLYSKRRQSFDAQKFEDAMTKAILILQTDDAFDVSMNENGYLYSNVPKFSISCRLRRRLWEYKRAFLTMVGFLCLIAYVRVKRYFHELHERRVDEAHASALEYLRDQVNAFRNNEEDLAFVPDVVLREEVVGRPTPENKKFWKEVEERLNRDARVMRKHQVLKGMPSYTFEYVGSRRVSGRRNSGSFFESLSRRSSFGSRTSLDSFDLGQEGNLNGTQRKGFLDFVVRFFSQKTD